MKTLVCCLLVFLYSNWLPVGKAHAQMYNFTEILENLLIQRPQTGDSTIRRNSFISIDELVLNSGGRYHDEMYKFYSLMLEKAMSEIRTEKVIQGATVWQIYNHGFIVKTPSVLIGFDLYDYFNTANLQKLADSLDIIFISHDHKDHLSSELETAMKNQNKPVIRYLGLSTHVSTTINLGDSINKLTLLVTQHTGLHNVPVQMFEVVTPEGIKIFHTGDNQTSETLPDIENVDIMLLNAWVNESGWKTWIEGSRNAIAKIKPRVTLPGHILELGHIGESSIVPYNDVFIVNEADLGCDYHVLAWGERYHFDDTSNDTIRPNPVNNPRAEITNDSIIIFWDTPSIAEDAETVSFYRFSRKGSDSFLTQNRRISFNWDTIGTYPCKIFSYDHCGNQCYNHADMNVTVPDENYPPRIISCTPSSEDSFDMFSGVYKVFNLKASDPNNDLLTYSWKLDDIQVQNGQISSFIYNFTELDTGIHRLQVSVSDQNLSQQHSWILFHHNLIAIIDNSDTIMYSDYGHWNSYSNSTALNGSLRFSYLTNVGDWASYKYYPEIQGNYHTYTFIPNQINGSSLAVYYVLINQQPVDTININQGNGIGQWLELGKYFLPESSEVEIRVVNTGRAKKGVSLLTDAIKFIYTNDPTGIQASKYQIPGVYTDLNCSPNPFSEYALISLDNQWGCPYTIKIFTLTGRLIRIEQNILCEKFILEKKGLEAGIYFIEINGPINYRGKIAIQ